MTLDGEERTLHEEDLMICDSEKPMCIAGVYGGINTGVTEDTRNIFLESAYFDPVSIRKTAKRHGLNTDASFRFERGIDINNVEYALVRAAILIRDIAGGEITSDVIDLFPKKMPDHNVFLTYDKIHLLIGQEIPRDTIIAILASLDIQVKSVTESGLGLVIPFYRVDVRREVDVIEEILRVYGYNNIPDKKKFTASIVPPETTEPHSVQSRIGQQLAAGGFYEIMGNSLCNPAHNALLGADQGEAVPLINPLSKELSELRRDLIFSGLGSVAHNLNRKQQDLKLFEFGKIYRRQGEQWREENRLSVLVSGNRSREHWTGKGQPMGFFYLKGIVGNLMDGAGITGIQETPLKDPRFSEALQLSCHGETLVELGLVRPAFLDVFDIRQDVFYADIRWDALLEQIRSQSVQFEEIPRFPEVRRDLALLLDQQVSFQELYQQAFQTEQKLLKEVQLFDVYTGDKLPAGKKSYALSFYLQDERKTLTDGQIDAIMKKLQLAFEKEFAAELR
jgi:phenylalanyl-tRNA synthetase beta chain